MALGAYGKLACDDSDVFLFLSIKRNLIENESVSIDHESYH